MANPNEIIRRFTYQAPTEQTLPKHQSVNDETLRLAHLLDELLPDGREKACALTALQETRMWANAAVATCAKAETTSSI